MKEFWVYWSVLLLLLFFFCAATHLLLFGSACYIPLFLISLVWVVEILVFSVLFVKMLDQSECAGVSRMLFSDGALFLIIGMVTVFKMGNMVKDSGILMITSVFCFCSSILSVFFGSIIKNKKSDVERSIEKD